MFPVTDKTSKTVDMFLTNRQNVDGKHYYTNEGFLRISLLDFLMNQDSLDW